MSRICILCEEETEYNRLCLNLSKKECPHCGKMLCGTHYAWHNPENPPCSGVTLKDDPCRNTSVYYCKNCGRYFCGVWRHHCKCIWFRNVVHIWLEKRRQEENVLQNTI